MEGILLTLQGDRNNTHFTGIQTMKHTEQQTKTVVSQSMQERAFDMLVKDSIKRLRKLAKGEDRSREGDDKDGVALAGRLKDHITAIEAALRDWEDSLSHRKKAKLAANKKYAL